jgi:hypothetical protein
MSGGNGSGGAEPLFHLIVANYAGLLHYHAAAIEDYEIGYAANVVTRGKLRIFFGINFYDYGFAGHVGGGPCHFGSSGAARAAPIGPEIYEYGDGRVLNDFIELRIIDRERFRDGRQRRFTSSATAGVGEMFGGNAIVLSAISASANDRHRRPPSYLNGAEDKMQAIRKRP